MKYILAHEAAVQWVVDVVGLGHVHHEVGGRAEPVAAGEEELSARRQVVGAHNGGQDLLSYGGHRLVGPSVVRKAHCYLQRRGRLRDSEFVGQQTVHLRDGVVAEQGGGDA